MNVHTKIEHTAAEEALLDSYAQRFSELPGNAGVARMRDDAVELLKAGLPTRKVEAWHYTDLRRFLSAVPPYDSTAHAETVAALVDGASVLPLLNGVSGKTPALEGLSIGSTAERLSEGTFPDRLQPVDGTDSVGAINASLAADGYVLDIAEGAELASPVEIQNVQAGGQVHTRLSCRVGAGAKATIIERQTGTGEALVSSISHLDVGDEADASWLIVQEQPSDTTYLGQMNLTIGRNARLTLFIMNAGGKLVRQEVRAVSAGEGSEFRLRGINLLAGYTHCDVTMVLDHTAENTVSTETVRNVVTGRAQGVFQGQIRVAKQAQKTDAKMACNTLLLSEDGEFSCKPELEIFADDVACGHGATVTEISADHLFYLMARGIDERTARGLLVKAFVAEIIEELEDEALIAALEDKMESWFSDNV